MTAIEYGAEIFKLLSEAKDYTAYSSLEITRAMLNERFSVSSPLSAPLQTVMPEEPSKQK